MYNVGKVGTSTVWLPVCGYSERPGDDRGPGPDGCVVTEGDGRAGEGPWIPLALGAMRGAVCRTTHGGCQRTGKCFNRPCTPRWQCVPY